ncbi:MAG TPA: hypothetical protein VF637_12860 [Sphingomicrobium sp.]|jgi:hypothetical protein
MSIDWNGPLQSSHTPPRHAFVMPDDPLFPGCKRVGVMGDFQFNCWTKNKQYDWSTVWHYNLDGTLGDDPAYTLVRSS